jgi:hypothetical protein
VVLQNNKKAAHSIDVAALRKGDCSGWTSSGLTLGLAGSSPAISIYTGVMFSHGANFFCFIVIGQDDLIGETGTLLKR